MVVPINGFILIIDYHWLEEAANAATFMLPTLLNPPSCEGGLVFCWSVLLSRKISTRLKRRSADYIDIPSPLSPPFVKGRGLCLFCWVRLGLGFFVYVCIQLAEVLLFYLRSA